MEIDRKSITLSPGQRMDGQGSNPPPWPLPSGYTRAQVKTAATGPIVTMQPEPQVSVDMVSPFARGYVLEFPTPSGPQVGWAAELDASAPGAVTVEVTLSTR